MKILKKILSGFFWAGLTQEEYNCIRNDFKRANERILLWMSVSTAFTMATLGVASLFLPGFRGALPVYTVIFFINIVIFILTKIIGAKNVDAIQALAYVFSATVYAFAIYIGAFKLTNTQSVAFIVAIVSMPLAFSERPIFSAVMAWMFSIVYLAIARYTKPATIWTADMYNIISYSFSGLILNLLLNKFKTSSMLSEYHRNMTNELLERKTSEYQAIHVALKSGDWRVDLSPDGTIAGYEWSNESCRLYGYRDAEDMPKGFGTWFDMIVEEDRDKMYREFHEIIDDVHNERNMDIEYRVVKKDGMTGWFRSVGRLMRDDDGKPKTIWGVVIDIDEEKRARDDVVRELAVVEALSRDYRDVFIINLDQDRSVTVKTNGKMVDDFVSHVRKYDGTWERYVSKFVHPDDAERVLKVFERENVEKELKKNGEIVCNYRVLLDKEIYHLQVKYIYVPKTDVYDSFIVSGYRGIDDIIAAEEEYNRNLQAAISEVNATKETLSVLEIDDLTGLYTRQAFLKRAADTLIRNSAVEYNLLITDFEDFKIINDQYGTKVGDDLLKWYGGYLKDTVDESTLVGRYAGDQFAILARKDVMDERKVGLSATVGTIQPPLLPAVVVKAGIYENIKHDQAITVLCDRAHMALKSIKHQYGKNVAVYDEKVKKHMEMQRHIELGMHKAIDDEQFRVFYQPKHNSKTGELVGAEALIRWEHPDYGFMSPSEFIPLFEKSGFVTEADCYVWEHTCENLKKWKEKGLDLVPISVNASRMDFLHKDFLDRLDDAVCRNEVSKELLHIEVTETIMTEEIEPLVETLTAFKKKGYKIELDDFGVGYSSLNILSTLPIDVVKLDMSFMRQFKDIKKSKILAACIELAKNLGLKTISEGVETKEQIEMLNGMGIDSVQGYYYSKPLPEEEFAQYLEKYKK